MACGTHKLAQRLLHIVVVVLKLLLTRHIDGILVRLVVCHAAAVAAHLHQVVVHLLHELVETAAELALLGLAVTAFLGASILPDRLPVGILVRVGHRRLVDVEERADLAVVNALVLLLLFGIESLIGRTAYGVFGVVAVHVFVPVIEYERHALLVFAHCRATRLGFVVEREDIGPAAVPIRVECHKQRIERADRHTLRIETRITFAGGIEPVPVGMGCFAEGCGKQGDMFLLGILFYL